MNSEKKKIKTDIFQISQNNMALVINLVTFIKQVRGS